MFMVIGRNSANKREPYFLLVLTSVGRNQARVLVRLLRGIVVKRKTGKFGNMPYDQLSHFDEKSGIVRCPTPWGCWWQTVQEIHIEVTLPPNTKSKEITVNIKPKSIEVTVKKELIFKGNLFHAVHGDDSVWTVEDNSLLDIVLSKADTFKQNEIWESLLEDQYKPDPLVLHEMRKKLDLERFQIENPGFDFSQAKLQKCYDKPPV